MVIYYFEKIFQSQIPFGFRQEYYDDLDQLS